jgi:predicted nucleotidyltransferase
MHTDLGYNADTMKRDDLLDLVKRTIRAVEPGADIILYGSRSRGDSGRGSDWDFLVLVDGSVDDERTDKIRHLLYEIEWEHGEVLSTIVRSRAQWHQHPYCLTPLHERIEAEGLRL